MQSRFCTALITVALMSVCAMPGPLGRAQTHHSASQPAATAGMSNSDVIALASAGLGDSIIIAKIHAAPSTNFDTSIAGLTALKQAGVSSAVISYMVDPSAPPPAAPMPPPASAAAAAPAGNSDDPDSIHPPGIYIQATANDGKVHLTKLDHITAKRAKTSGTFLSGMTYGITKAHVKVILDGDKATVHTQDTDPYFYAYIPEDNNSFGGNTISIKDFSLIKLDPKADSREVNTATISPWGASMGTDEKAKQGFTAELVKPGIYKLTLNQALPVGQYAFQHQNYGAFFDFGITPKE